ncbi:MAG: sigma-54 dependent transcriptional regulator [Bacteroidetes bacterium]|nr:sigma-54 dependent transcriptional regulator [Bacteroidota bacterium]MBU1114626.1 sigma-54 dependent transcriptional regulator [Bacteroidota bacterium]MBU1797804.1 sigma-54 dependent transcriptional regulator [Bacteroidota bacterium]
MQKLSILLIDDEESIIASIKSFLLRRGHTIYTASNGQEGVDVIKSNVIDLVLTDYRMPIKNGLEVLKETKEINPNIDVVVITAFGNVEDAIGIMKNGAYDYLTKPIDLDELENLINRVGEKRVLISENKILREQLQEKFKFNSIISQSGEMEDVLNIVGRVANSKATVMVRGDSGTGKEVIAKAIHYASNRKDKPFVVVNVASLSENLMESELFGHEKGAFTGAINQRKGRFEEADGGTLFIDEVGDIPLSIQVKLLRGIQFGEIQRLGSSTPIKVNVRIIAATHRNLEEMIKNEEFREDLYYRLNVVSVKIPKLRERRVDIPLLVEYFIKKYAEINEKNVSGITSEALDKIVKYNFPGNVRELENMIERAIVLCRDENIGIKDLPLQVDASFEKMILDPQNLDNEYEEKMKSFETEIIKEALNRTNGNQSAAARILNITERHLRSRLERLGLKRSRN